MRFINLIFKDLIDEGKIEYTYIDEDGYFSDIEIEVVRRSCTVYILS